MITIDSVDAAAGFAGLLEAVEHGGEAVIICRQGQPIAALRGTFEMRGYPDPLVQHPELKFEFHYDPMEGASEDEWPQAQREC